MMRTSLGSIQKLSCLNFRYLVSVFSLPLVSSCQNQKSFQRPSERRLLMSWSLANNLKCDFTKIFKIHHSTVGKSGIDFKQLLSCQGLASPENSAQELLVDAKRNLHNLRILSEGLSSPVTCNG